MDAPSYGLTRELPGVAFEPAIERVTDALKTEGFGVLTRIDVHKTLHARLGIEFPEYAILGSCNPGLAHRSLVADPWIGLLLPCNVVVRTIEGGGTAVSIANPVEMFRVVDRPEMDGMVAEVEARLRAVLARI